MIKLSEDHYVVVDESIQPVNGLYYDAFVNSIENTSEAEYGKSNHCWQITRSTQPIEEWKSVSYGGDGTIRKKIYDKIKPLSLQEVKELLGEVDVEKMAEEALISHPDFKAEGYSDYQNGRFNGIVEGYKQALEDNKERKYTETDIKNAIIRAYSIMGDRIDVGYFNEVIQTLQPITEWEVEFVDGKLKLI